MIKDHKIKETVKRFSITEEEREQFRKLVATLEGDAIHLEGSKFQLMMHSNGVRQRLKVTDEAPKGFIRNIDFDRKTYDILVIDTPSPKEPVKEKKEDSEAKLVN